jgi:predicted amidohydrolase
MRVAAIQMQPVIGDVEANLDRAEVLADAAAAAGAELIALPEFFTTGMAFDARIADCALAPDGAATELLRDLGHRHGAWVGGSFICRDGDGHNRNAYLLATPEGEIAGRHNKDLPTMWENCFYAGGAAGDDGVIDAGEFTVGAAVCWEFMRSQTARRLRGRADVIVGGSAWWSIPEWPPAGISRRLEARNAETAAKAPIAMAPLVGAPVVHAANIGEIECTMPPGPVPYRGHLQGGAVICDAHGRVLARRHRREGPGIALADIEVESAPPTAAIPSRYWLHDRGIVATYAWEAQKLHGRRWYRQHALGRPALQIDRKVAAAA